MPPTPALAALQGLQARQPQFRAGSRHSFNQEDRDYYDRVDTNEMGALQAAEDEQRAAVTANVATRGSGNPNIASSGPNELHSGSGPSIAALRDLYDADPIRRRFLEETGDEKIREFQSTALPLGLATARSKADAVRYSADQHRAGQEGAASLHARGALEAAALGINPTTKTGNKISGGLFGKSHDEMVTDPLIKGTQDKLFRGLQQAGPGGNLRAQVRDAMKGMRGVGDLSDAEIDHLIANPQLLKELGLIDDTGDENPDPLHP